MPSCVSGARQVNLRHSQWNLHVTRRWEPIVEDEVSSIPARRTRSIRPHTCVASCESSSIDFVAYTTWYVMDRRTNITRLATTDEQQAGICTRDVAQYLRWTLLFALFYEAVHKANWTVIQMRAGVLKVTIHTKQLCSIMERILLLSSAEAELIAASWDNRFGLSLYGQLDFDETCIYHLLW